MIAVVVASGIATWRLIEARVASRLDTEAGEESAYSRTARRAAELARAEEQYSAERTKLRQQRASLERRRAIANAADPNLRGRPDSAGKRSDGKAAPTTSDEVLTNASARRLREAVDSSLVRSESLYYERARVTAQAKQSADRAFAAAQEAYLSRRRRTTAGWAAGVMVGLVALTMLLLVVVARAGGPRLPPIRVAVASMAILTVFFGFQLFGAVGAMIASATAAMVPLFAGDRVR